MVHALRAGRGLPVGLLQALVASFFEEGLLLLDPPEEELATTMLIAPKYEGGIGEFYSLYEWLTDLLESEEEEVLANGVQPAFFHPAWSFDGLPADSPPSTLRSVGPAPSSTCCAAPPSTGRWRRAYGEASSSTSRSRRAVPSPSTLTVHCSRDTCSFWTSMFHRLSTSSSPLCTKYGRSR